MVDQTPLLLLAKVACIPPQLQPLLQAVMHFSYIAVVSFIRWHMTPADVNAYYNSPNNYIGSSFSNSNLSSLACS